MPTARLWTVRRACWHRLVSLTGWNVCRDGGSSSIHPCTRVALLYDSHSSHWGRGASPTPNLGWSCDLLDQKNVTSDSVGRPKGLPASFSPLGALRPPRDEG